MKRNAQDVWKSSPEEQQTLAEIEALVSELKAMGMATQGMGLGQVAGGPAAGLPGSVQAGQGAPAPGLGQGQPGQAPGYGGTDDDYSEDGELDGSGDDQNDPDQYDQTDEPDGDEGEDPDQAGNVDINARNQEKKPMNANNLARKAAQMAGVSGDRTITPESPATAPQGKGDDNWGEDGFDDPDTQGEPKAPPSGQDDGRSDARSAMKAYKAKLMRELANVNKAIEATPHNGSDALDSADEILGDLPAYDIEDVEDLSRKTGASPAAVEKMLVAINARHTQKVQKSQEIAEMNDLRRTVQKQSQILDEVLSGIRAAAGVEGFPAAEPQRTVNKSARPVSTYPHDQARGGDILSQIADLVVQKSGGMRQVGQSYGDPELDALLGSDGGNPNTSRGQNVHKSMSAFADLFGQTAGSQWGVR